MNSSYFPNDWREVWVSYLSAAYLSVARFGDGYHGERIRTGYDDRSGGSATADIDKALSEARSRINRLERDLVASRAVRDLRGSVVRNLIGNLKETVHSAHLNLSSPSERGC